MCDREDCPVKDNPRSKYLRWAGEDVIKGDPRFTPEMDMMPDGFHAKPIRLWALRRPKSYTDPRTNEPDFNALREKRRQEYMGLPEPRPNYYDWLALMDEEDRFWDAYWIRKTARYPSDRLKAISQVNDASKAKPKQSLEILANAKDVDIDDLLVRLLKAKGMSDEAIEKVVRVN